MRFRLSTPIPSWTRVVAIFMLVVVTVLLIGSHVVDFSFTKPQPYSPERIAQLEDKEQTLDLATEFGYDPMIVQLTRKLAADAFKKRYCACPAWRFIPNERHLTYLVLSLIQTESRGNPAAVNGNYASGVSSASGRAYGLTQLVLTTARQYDKNVTESELLTIPKNLSIAMNHYIDLLEKYQGNVYLVAAAWNRGTGTVDRLLLSGNSPENGYVKRLFTEAAMRNAWISSSRVR